VTQLEELGCVASRNLNLEAVVELNGSVALVTGANRGIGREIAAALLAAGAAKVYAGVRDPTSVTDERLVPVRIDVTDPASAAAAARELGDVTLVVSNAGVGSPAGHVLDPDGPLDGARAELEVNYLGQLNVARAFAPVLAANGGGALVNILSVASWLPSPMLATYAASKAAAWSMTNSLRGVLREQGTLVTGVHFGFADTDLTRGIDAPKLDPADVAAAIVDGIAAGQEEILVDPISEAVKGALADDVAALYAVLR
jgi:NAD(P)-dependent dehydrogenase (short-subunit alcohol dehydrogenase family)